jgi:hypothetical protein
MRNFRPNIAIFLKELNIFFILAIRDESSGVVSQELLCKDGNACGGACVVGGD